MGRKKHRPAAQEQTAAEYYRLNTKAVDDLVTATEENSPQVSEKELRKYRSGPKIKLKDWVKVILIKWWFNGAVCFFFFWGLGTMVGNTENQLLILGIGLGLVTDLLVNSIFRYYAKTKGANDRWMMVARRGVPGLLLNLVYAFVLLGLVVMTYNMINRIALLFTGPTDGVPVGVEPILFGLLTMGWDMLLLGARRVVRHMVADAKSKQR